MFKLGIVQVQVTDKAINAYFSDETSNSMKIDLNEIEQQEFGNLGRKILQRFASEIMATQVHSDSYRANPKPFKVAIVEDKTPLNSESIAVFDDKSTGVIKDPNQLELPHTEEKSKRGRKPKEPVVTKSDLDASIAIVIAKQIETDTASLETLFQEIPHTIDDLRTAVQEFISKNGKTEAAAQTAKLKTLFAIYGGSDVSTFPKAKIGECIAKIQNL